jgi:hypothetical protein
MDFARFKFFSKDYVGQCGIMNRLYKVIVILKGLCSIVRNNE